MVQLIQGIIDALRYPSYSYFVNNDNVDPNVVRYFRTEYGKHWQDASTLPLQQIKKLEKIRGKKHS